MIEKFKNGIDKVKLAIENDINGNYEKAIKYYNEAIDILNLYAEETMNFKLKKFLENRIFQYHIRIEEIVHGLKTTETIDTEVPHTFGEPKKIFDEGMKKGQEAEKLDKKGKKEEAYRLYMDAADILMNFAKISKDSKLKHICMDKTEQYIERVKKIRNISGRSILPSILRELRNLTREYSHEIMENPLEILKLRLVKGEISLEEFEKVKSTLEQSNLNQNDYMYCSNCGKKIPSNSKFCIECGLKIL